jgi:dUTP pyrophosphatase
MYPRSSFSKTPLILGNHVGIIDSGYRGNLIGAFKFLPNDKYATNYTIEKEQRLLQICHPTLCPIYVILAENDDLQVTERGSGGFGSTGI